jgi:hypothetical protein
MAYKVALIPGVETPTIPRRQIEAELGKSENEDVKVTRQ